MTKKDTGGPAFPVHEAQALHRIGAAAIIDITDPVERDRVYIEVTALAAQGMTLRDHFAGLAMQALVADTRSDRAAHRFQKDSSEIAYQQADAMIKARSA